MVANAAQENKGLHSTGSQYSIVLQMVEVATRQAQKMSSYIGNGINT